MVPVRIRIAPHRRGRRENGGRELWDGEFFFYWWGPRGYALLSWIWSCLVGNITRWCGLVSHVMGASHQWDRSPSRIDKSGACHFSSIGNTGPPGDRRRRTRRWRARRRTSCSTAAAAWTMRTRRTWEVPEVALIQKGHTKLNTKPCQVFLIFCKRNARCPSYI